MDVTEWFDEIDKLILTAVNKIGQPTIYQIWKVTGLSWSTIKKHGKKLEKLGILNVNERPNGNNPRIEFQLSTSSIDLSKIRPFELKV